MRLRDKMNAGGTGAELARAVYEFLTETQAADRLHTAADALALDGEPDAAADALRLWDLLMALLDQTALVLRAPLDGRRYGRLLELAIQSAKLGELPQSLDEVTVGGADRTRPSAPRVVFLAGAVQGVFPAAAGGGGGFEGCARRSAHPPGGQTGGGRPPKRGCAFQHLCRRDGGGGRSRRGQPGGQQPR